MPVFPVSDTTQKILKNFSGLSDQLLLVEGKTQRTRPKSKALFAIAELPEAWPKETAIYNLPQFLGVLSKFDKAAIEFGNDLMKIRDVNDDADALCYNYADPSTVLSDKDRTFPTDHPSIEFTLSQPRLSRIRDFASLVSLNLLTIDVANGVVSMAVVDEKNTKFSNTFKSNVNPDDTKVHVAGFTTSVRFKVEHIALLLDGAYTVSLAAWPYGFFQHKTLPVSYFIAQKSAK